MAGRLFILLFVIANVMGSVRYLLRWGEPSSSPSYSAIPPEYFLAWNLITIAMIILVLSHLRTFSLRVLTGYLFVFMLGLVCYFQVDSFHVKGAIRSLVFNGLFFTVLFSNNRWLNIRHFDRAIEFMAVYGIAYLALQGALFLGNGILPAHSHPGDLIRFGSFYDDSLVLGAMLPLFAGYYFQKFRTFTAWIVVGIAFNLVAMLTGSMTAVAVAVLFTIWSYRSRPLLLYGYMAACLMLLAIFSDELFRVVAFKSESIQLHVEGFEKLLQLGVVTLGGLYPNDTFAESGYVLLLINLGLPVLVLLIVQHLATFYACHKLMKKEGPERTFAGATEGLIFSVLLFNLNLPVIIISPVYLVLAIFSAVTLSMATQRKRVPTSTLCIPRV